MRGGTVSTSILISLSAIRGLTENIPDDLFKTLKLPFSSLIFQSYAPTEITRDVLSQSQRLPYRPSCACATWRREMATVLIETQVKQEHLFWSGLWCNAMKRNQLRWLVCELCYYYQDLCHVAPQGFARCWCPMQTDQYENKKKKTKQSTKLSNLWVQTFWGTLLYKTVNGMENSFFIRKLHRINVTYRVQSVQRVIKNT